MTAHGRTTKFPVDVTDEVFFEENMRNNIQTVCSTFLAETKKMVQEAGQGWG